MRFKSDAQRRACFANLFSRDNILSNMTLFSDKSNSVDIVPLKEYDLAPVRGGDGRAVVALDWLNGNIDTDLYIRKKRTEFNKFHYFTPTDIGDDAIRELVDEFRNPDNYFDAEHIDPRLSGKFRFTDASKRTGFSPETIRHYFYDAHEEVRPIQLERTKKYKEKWGDVRIRPSKEERLEYKHSLHEFKKNYRPDLYELEQKKIADYNRRYLEAMKEDDVSDNSSLNEVEDEI